MEQEIIQPIDKEVLKSELTPERQLRMTNKSHNEIYIITAHNAPNVMKEIGRLREIVFREAGGGTGKEMDIDEFDICENCYKQLIVWNPEAEEIIGGYRYLEGTEWEMDDQGQPKLATSHMFHFSDKFLKEYMPYTIELGRSFVSLPYQSSRMGAKSLFALDNLWDGLGALTVIMPNVKYFFGKMTMYPSYIRKGRDMILYFLKKHFDDKDHLIIPMKPLEIEADPKELEALFCANDFKANYRILNAEIRKLGYNIPPLVNAYMNLSPTMKLFGTAINYGFGDVEETGILIAVDEILAEKRVRHIDSYIKDHPEALKITSGANKVIYKEQKERP
ncbi:MAG: GNAT family N-acetyltransferase [Prevotella sp.]|nr:GNAT family N-acetyltransferase [Prevotella sp.]